MEVVVVEPVGVRHFEDGRGHLSALSAKYPVSITYTPLLLRSYPFLVINFSSVLFP